MKIRKNIISYFVYLSACVIGVFGCNHFDTEEYAPVFPAADEASRISNFQVEAFVSELFEWNRGQNCFCLNIPESGDYLLTYVTLKNETPSLITIPASRQLQSFVIAFRASTPAYISIGLQEEESLDSLILQRGTMKHEAVGLYDDGPITRYASPSIPTIFWKDVFMLAPEVSPLTLERGLFPCPPKMSSGLE